MLKKQVKVTFTKDKVKTKVFVSPPSYIIDQELKTHYAIAYKRAIQMGVATRSSMLELLAKEGIWTDVEEKKLLDLTVKAASIELELRQSESESKDKQKDCAIRLVGVRAQLYALIQVKTAPLEHTAESIAEDVKLDRLISSCTFYEDGKPYFKNHEDFLSRRNSEDVLKILNEVLKELSKDNIEMIRNLPENKWLIDNQIMSEDGSVKEKEIINLVAVAQGEDIKE